MLLSAVLRWQDFSGSYRSCTTCSAAVPSDGKFWRKAWVVHFTGCQVRVGQLEMMAWSRSQHIFRESRYRFCECKNWTCHLKLAPTSRAWSRTSVHLSQFLWPRYGWKFSPPSISEDWCSTQEIQLFIWKWQIYVTLLKSWKKLRDQWDGILAESKLVAESRDTDPSLASAFSKRKRKILLTDKTVLGAEFSDEDSYDHFKV